MKISEHLTEKYVAYLDVLGFKEIVKNDKDKLDIYFNTITQTLNDLDDTLKVDRQLISDSTILACDINTESLAQLLRTVQKIQASCAINNIWIRGAISIGDIYFNRDLNIVVGNGLVNAYLLEMEAQFPRVIIDPRIIQRSYGNRNIFLRAFNDFSGNANKKEIPLIHNIEVQQKFIDDDAFFVAFAEKIMVDNIDDTFTVFENIKKELYNGQLNFQKFFWLKKYFLETNETTVYDYFYKYSHEQRMVIESIRAELWDKFYSL
jgi:hypothetical protein